MRVLPVSYGLYQSKLVGLKQKNQPNLQTFHQNEPSFKSKSAWKGVGGAVLGAVIAGPIGALLLGGIGAGYGAIEDELDEDKKNGTDWSKMPDIA